MLTPWLFETIFNLGTQRTSYKQAHVFAVGSILQKLVLKKTNIIQRALHKRQPKVTILGSGFIHDFNPKNFCIQRRLAPMAVRGKLSLHLLQQLFPCTENVITGDLGILANHLLLKPSRKSYALGIMAHYAEQKHPAILSLRDKMPEALWIDVLEPPLQVLQKISQCETILSSSLHGLIAADSLLIPNKHLLISSLVLGNGFKFRDYYSNYELTDDLWLVEDLARITCLPEAIHHAYCIKPSQVEAMQQRLFQKRNAGIESTA